MSKKKKKRRSIIPESEAKNAVKKSFAEFNWRILGKLILYFTIIFGLYQLGIKLAEIYNNKLILDIVVNV